jgi:hypothetical protein
MKGDRGRMKGEPREDEGRTEKAETDIYLLFLYTIHENSLAPVRLLQKKKKKTVRVKKEFLFHLFSKFSEFFFRPSKTR